MVMLQKGHQEQVVGVEQHLGAMVVHQEVEEWEDFLRCSLEEEGSNLVQRKASQN